MSFELEGTRNANKIASFGKLNLPNFDVGSETTGSDVSTTGRYRSVTVNHLKVGGRHTTMSIVPLTKFNNHCSAYLKEMDLLIGKVL